MAYASASNVGALTPNLLGSGSNFTTATTPSLAEVELFLTSACADLHVALNMAGYTTPVTSAAAPAVYDQLSNLSTLFAAGYAEMTRATTRLGPGERTRGQVFLEMYQKGLAWLLARDLSRAGVGTDGVGTLYAGGISKDDVTTVEADSDRVKPRFKRDLLRFPGTIASGDVDTDELRRAE